MMGTQAAGWRALAAAQQGMLARRQLRELGISADRVRNQIRAGRWAPRTATVVSTFTGPPTAASNAWLGVLHAGGDSLVGGLSAAALQGLRRWERDVTTVLVPAGLKVEPVPGMIFVRTRRCLRVLRDPAEDLPICRIEPAVLLHAAYVRSAREALGLLAATVQQRLTTPRDLVAWIDRMQPLRRAGQFRLALVDIQGGAQSMSEIDVARICRAYSLPPPRRQVRRRDSSGRIRYIDCEWWLPGGLVLVLEVDGGFHMDAAGWEDDIARQRGLSSPDRIVVRCTARELREEPERVIHDLERLGVRRAA